MSLAFAGDDRIVAGNRDGSLFVWSLPVEPPAESDVPPVKGEGHPLWPSRQLEGHSNCVSHVVALRDGSQVFSASYDHSVRIWLLDGETKEKGEAVLDIDQRKAEAKKKRIDQLTPRELSAIDKKLTKDALSVFDLKTAMKRRTAIGAPGDAEVDRRLAYWREFLEH